MDDLHQLVISAVQHCHQSAADGCFITLIPSDGQEINVSQAGGIDHPVAGQASALHFILIPDTPDSAGGDSTGSNSRGSNSSSSSRSMVAVSRMLAGAGVEVSLSLTCSTNSLSLCIATS